jgi:hypothetical protein
MSCVQIGEMTARQGSDGVPIIDRGVLQQNCPLFDHLIGARLKHRRNREPHRVSGLEVDNKLEFG